jgi:hypothetical protein
MVRVRLLWSRSAPVLVPALVLLAAVLLMCWRVWTPIAGERRVFGWDVPWQYWADLQLQVASIGDGEWPLWNPYDRFGYPLHADPQAGLLYPVQWLLILIGLVTGPGLWLMTVKTILHFWIAALGTYALLAHRRLPTAACYLGALVVITGYPMLQNTMSALNWSFAWAPWMVLAVEVWAARPTLGRGAQVGGAVGMGFLAGAPATFWYGVIVAVPWAILALVEHARAAHAAGRLGGYARAAAVSAGVAVAVMIALVAAQLVATSPLIGESVRDRRDLAFFAGTIFDAVDVIGFFVPRAVGQNSYLGWGVILCAGAALALRPSPRVLLCAALFGVAVLCSLGDRGPVLPVLASLVEPFEMFRRAHRYLYVASIPLAYLAAEGLALLATVEGDERERMRRGVLAATALLILVCAIGFAVRHTAPWKPDAARDAWGWGVGTALIGGASIWLVIVRRGAELRTMVVGAVVIAGLDLWVCRFQKIEINLAEIPVTPNDRRVRELPGVPLETRIYDRGWVRFRPGVRMAVRDVGGYEDDPLALARYTRLLDAVRKEPRHLAHAGAGYLFEGKDLENGATVLPKSAADKEALTAMPELGSGAWRVAGPAPSVAWYDAAVIARDAADAHRQLLAAPAGSRAVLEARSLDAAERARAERIDGAVATTRGALVALGRNRLRATIEAPADGVVVILEGYYQRGWTATVDGAPARIVPANGAFRGVLVGPGAHVIEMEYGAPVYKALAVLVPLALIAIAGLLWRDRRRESGVAA